MAKARITKKTGRTAAARSLTEAIAHVAASFTPEAIAQVKDLPKRAQLLLGLARARKLLAEKPAKKASSGAPRLAATAQLGTPLTEAEWQKQYPAR